MRSRHARRSPAAAFAAVCLGGLLAGVAYALPGSGQERPASEVTAYVADLREAAALAEEAAAATARVAAGSKACSQVTPAAGKLAEAADAAKAVFQRYRNAKTRYGTQEEIELVARVAISLREARGQLEKAAGEPGTPSAAEQKAAEREVGLFQTFVALELEDRLEVEGLADVLTSRGFREMKAKIVTELQTRLRQRAEAELRRITGLRIRLGVPLKQQIRDFLEAEFSRLLSKLTVSAGPAGILVSILGQRIFNLIGGALKEALRQKGNLDGRTETTLAGFERLRRTLNALPPNAPLDKVRAAVRSAQRALGATAFLIGDLKRAKRNDLLLDLQDAEADLKQTLKRSRHRFLLDSALVGENFRFDVAYSAKLRADSERLAKKLGCPITAPPPGGGGTPPPGSAKAPTAAVCKPTTIRMEYHSSLGGKLGEYDAHFGKLVQTYPPDPYLYKCLWMTEPGGTAEAFVAFIDLVPAGLPGRITSGDCGRNRPDSPPFYHSRKRYLTVSGGNRAYFQNALGGNERILKGVLAAAEAAGVGQACPKR